MSTLQPSDTATPNGLHVGDKVTITRPSLRREHGVFTIHAIIGSGLRTRLTNASGADLGWDVDCYQLTPASDAAKLDDIRDGIVAKAAPLHLRCQAGPYVVDLLEISTARCTLYRVEVQNGHGGLATYDTRDGEADLARTYTTEVEARQVARDMTILLRAGMSPEAVASLLFGTFAALGA